MQFAVRKVEKQEGRRTCLQGRVRLRVEAAAGGHRGTAAVRPDVVPAWPQTDGVEQQRRCRKFVARHITSSAFLSFPSATTYMYPAEPVLANLGTIQTEQFIRIQEVRVYIHLKISENGEEETKFCKRTVAEWKCL